MSAYAREHRANTMGPLSPPREACPHRHASSHAGVSRIGPPLARSPCADLRVAGPKVLRCEYRAASTGTDPSRTCRLGRGSDSVAWREYGSVPGRGDERMTIARRVSRPARGDRRHARSHVAVRQLRRGPRVARFGSSRLAGFWSISSADMSASGGQVRDVVEAISCWCTDAARAGTGRDFRAVRAERVVPLCAAR